MSRARVLVITAVAVALCGVGQVGAASAARPSTTPTWHVQPSPNPSGSRDATLADVTCPSATLCFAVGSSTATSSPYDTRRMALRWDGHTWSIAVAPAPAGSVDTHFTSVACSSASACTLVGWSTDSQAKVHALVERWSGASWNVQPNPAPAGTKLLAVDCPGATTCVATGDADYGNAPVALHWNGSTWSARTIPSHPGVEYDDYLSALSCSSPTLCTAVGEGYWGETGYPLYLLVARWNGTKWSMQSSAAPGGQRTAVLTGVSCPTASACFAVGDSYLVGDAGPYGYRRFAERWNGTKWAVANTPGPSGYNTFADISCASASACVAVGDPNAGGGMFADRWNGSTWSQDSTPNTSQNPIAVDCVDAVTCTEAGVGYSGGLQRTAIERTP